MKLSDGPRAATHHCQPAGRGESGYNGGAGEVSDKIKAAIATVALAVVGAVIYFGLSGVTDTTPPPPEPKTAPLSVTVPLPSAS